MNTIQLISIILASACFAFILYIGIKTDLLREKSPPETTQGCYSFSRFQLWVWTLVICPVFILCWGFSGLNPDINGTSLLLLGIPVSVSLTSSIVADTNEQAMRKIQPIGILELKTHKEGTSFWTDLLSDDKGQLSVGRLQNLIFTFAYVAIYISIFFNVELKEFPEFENQAFVLMGISSGGYVLGKAMKK